MWQYEQSTGRLTKDGVYIDTGYSGHGVGLNNPEDEALRNIGPIPCGKYTIGAPRVPVDHLGPFAMPLTGMSQMQVDPGEAGKAVFASLAMQMFGRSGFLIHGDSPLMNHTASDGCLIFQRSTRVMIAASDDKELMVVS
jgi:hypothetical protein